MAALGFLGIIIDIVLLIVFIMVVIAIFRIRDATVKTAEKLEQIHELLVRQNRDK